MTPPHDAKQAVEFLTLLWGERMPKGQLLLLHALENGKAPSRLPAGLAHWKGLPAILPPLTRKADVYLHVSAFDKQPPSGKRGTAATASMLAALWLDLDVNGGPANRTNGAPSMSAAVELCNTIVPPTLLVDSGYGLHAWWRFDEPWPLNTPEDRLAASELVKRWEVAHRRELDGAWKLDFVGDLARIMRLPGTTNHKGGLSAPVRLLEHRGESYPLLRLTQRAASRTAGLALTPAVSRDTAGVVEGGDLPQDTDFPWRKIEALRAADVEFGRAWTRSRNLSSNQRADHEDDDSAWDFAILSRLDYAGGFTDREIIAAAREHRRTHSTGKPEKLDRADYWWGSLAKIRSIRQGDRDKAQAKREEAKLIDELDELAATPVVLSDESTKRWDAFNRALGLTGEQRAVAWKQYGSDPVTAKQVLALANGVQIGLGTMDSLMRQANARAAMSVVGRIPLSMTKQPLWLGAWNVVLPLRVDEEQIEEERDQRALHWVASLIAQSGLDRNPEHHNQAIAERRPLLRDGHVLITAQHLYRHLIRVDGRRDLSRTDLPPLLSAAGFHTEKLSYHQPSQNGAVKHSSHTYWSIPEEALP